MDAKAKHKDTLAAEVQGAQKAADAAKQQENSVSSDNDDSDSDAGVRPPFSAMLPHRCALAASFAFWGGGHVALVRPHWHPADAVACARAVLLHRLFIFFTL